MLEAAADNSAVGKLLRELQEPRPAGQDCIPWLGETSMKERILRLCARSKIAINLRGLEYLQAQPGEDEDAAWKRLRPKLSYTGRQLDEVFLMEPSAVPTTGGSTPGTAAPGEPAACSVAASTPTPPGVNEPPAGGASARSGWWDLRRWCDGWRQAAYRAQQPADLAFEPDRQARRLGYWPCDAGGRSLNQVSAGLGSQITGAQLRNCSRNCRWHDLRA